MKCSLGISKFLEEISSLSHSVVFLYFFALITEEAFLIPLCYSLLNYAFYIFFMVILFEGINPASFNFMFVQNLKFSEPIEIPHCRL